MRNYLQFAFGMFLMQQGFAQEIREIPERRLPGKSLSVNIGASKAGTGDLYGVALGVEYEKMFRPKLSLSSELGMTIHDGSDLLIIMMDDGRKEDLSYRYTTAGVQLAGKLGYHFVRLKHIDAGLKVGGVVRYQSSSLADDRTTFFPVLTGYPLPLSLNRNLEPQRTLAVGGILQLFARYTFRKHIVAGFSAGFQGDSNGDVFLSPIGISIGKRF